MQARIVRHIEDIDPADWNRLAGEAQPFLRHEFLAALEATGCVGPGTGWQPEHLVLRAADGALLGAMPLYRKTDSWGEFVFDFAWADAYRRAGLAYFPKLVAAVPFTPASGPRLLAAPGPQAAGVRRALREAALAHARDSGVSSLHVLFPEAAQAGELAGAGLLLRRDCQFHWHNRGWTSFEEFLGAFTAEKRKKARRERRRVTEAGIELRFVEGGAIDAALWDEILPLHASTFWLRGRNPYLTDDFFRRVAQALPTQLLAVVARHRGATVAVALFFRGTDTLYGRYWGSTGSYHSLHFEACYYQGIEYCIAQGLQRFEPGTQGEHKVARGFAPQDVWSTHWLADPRFAEAIDHYLDRERDHVARYIEAVDAHVPYRQEST